MRMTLSAMYRGNPAARRHLLNTGNHVLVARNDSSCSQGASAKTPTGEVMEGGANGRGHNYQGRLLMELRNELREEERQRADSSRMESSC